MLSIPKLLTSERLSIVPDPSNDAGNTRKLTLLGVLTVAGDLLIISLLLLVFSLGIVTAAPAAVGALRARRDVSTRGPSGPSSTIWRGVRENFRSMWAVGPVALVWAVFAWIALAFWLTVPAPLSVIMISVVTLIAVVGGMLFLALPAARREGDTLRATLRVAVLLVVGWPVPSVLALLAFAAAVVLAFRFPAVGVALIGVAYVEIAYRAWIWQPPVRS